MDTRHPFMALMELVCETIDGASVHPGEIMKRALARRAASVILAHNHLSGVEEQRRADELISKRL